MDQIALSLLLAVICLILAVKGWIYQTRCEFLEMEMKKLIARLNKCAGQSTDRYLEGE